MLLQGKLKQKNFHQICVVNQILRGSTRKNLIRECQTSFHFDYERVKGTENAKWLKLTGRESVEKFIPVTRKSLLRKILEDPDLVSKHEIEDFQQLATRIDSALYVEYKRKLDKLKSLYNPLSPDRDTKQMKSFSSKQLLAREDEILQNLSKLLEEASFYELPYDIMIDALGENNVAEKMVVSVVPENYAVLKFWVVGMDVAPLDDRPWYVIAEERARSLKQGTSRRLDPLSTYNFRRSFFSQMRSKLWKKAFGQSVRRIARYKRVIVSVRRKGEMKLLVKAFKDIPCENLEFLLPDGKIKMGKLDKIRLLVQSSAILFLILSTTVTNLLEMKLETSLVVAMTALLILIRNGAIYKNMRNRHVLDMSQTLYFKSVASNHALLTLIVDRAEDEIYKSSLLTHAILHQIQSASVFGRGEYFGATDAEVKQGVENWLEDKFRINVNLSINATLEHLREWKIIEAEIKDNVTRYRALKLHDAKELMPHLKRPPLLHHADLLNINIERMHETDLEEVDAYLSYEGRYDWE